MSPIEIRLPSDRLNVAASLAMTPAHSLGGSSATGSFSVGSSGSRMTPSPPESAGPRTPGSLGHLSSSMPPHPMSASLTLSDASTASGPLAGPPGGSKTKYTAPHRLSLSTGRRPELTFSLSDESKEMWKNTIKDANAVHDKIVSDASRLPPSTGRRGIPAPAPKPEELATLGLCWEEDNVGYEHRKPVPLSRKKGRMMRAIPTMVVSDISTALPFYKEILGFSCIGKADRSLASICRTPSGKSAMQGAEEGVQIYLRTLWNPPAPSGSAGAAAQDKPEMPPPMSLYIEVASIDDMFDEIFFRAFQRTRPTEEDYFPSIAFGKARIHGRPMNTPFGTREVRVNDVDGNLLIFFQDTSADSAANASASSRHSTGMHGGGGEANLVRGPVQRKLPRGRR